MVGFDIKGSDSRLTSTPASDPITIPKRADFV